MKWSTTAPSSRTDLTYEIAYNPKFIPLRSPKASVRNVTEGGKTTHLMFNFSSGLFYELDEPSNALWELVDGKRTVGEIQRSAKVSGKIDKPDEVVPTLLFFAEAGMLGSLEETIKRKRLRVVSSFITEFTLIWNASRIFKAVHKVIRPVLRNFLVPVSIAVICLVAIFYAQHFVSIFGDARNFRILGSSVVGFLFYNYVILGPVVLIHELSHGLALVHYTGKAGEVGTGLFYFGPMFYVDIAGYWSLPRRQRIMIMWAGNLSTLLIGSSMVLLGTFLPFPSDIARTMDLIAFWCFYLTLWNLAPPFETDGYHILSDLVNQPNLRSDAFSLVKSTITRYFRRANNDEKTAKTENAKVLFSYAIFAIAFLGFIAFQTLRFTFYMASDSATWAGTIFNSILPGNGFSPLSITVGITTIVYFSLVASGYGILLKNQLSKVLARGLQFEALHDRDFCVFFYVPGQLGSRVMERVQKRTRSLASKITPNYSLGSRGSVVYANLRIGETKLPISRIKSQLHKIEREFFQVHQELIARKFDNPTSNLLTLQGPSASLNDLLFDMAQRARAGDRSQVKAALREHLQRQGRTARYLVTSTFATVWTIEVPPAGLYELLTNFLPGLMVEDLIMTDLPEEAEEFKKQIVYGLDSIADLAARSSEEREAALSKPERHQLVVSFEPISGRIMMIGRTESVEGHLVELASLFTIQAWSGYVDNLLADALLHLHSIVQSLPAIPDLTGLSDGELRVLRSYLLQIENLEVSLGETMDDSREAIRRASLALKGLRALFRSGLGGKPLDSVLDMNLENLQSIPNGLKEVNVLSREAISWTRTLKQPLEAELKKREQASMSRERKSARLYAVAGPASLGLVVVGLLLPSLFSFGLFTIASAVQALYFANYYLVRSSRRRIARYPSSGFSLILGSFYALARTLGGLVVGMRILKMDEVLEEEKQEERKKKEVQHSEAGLDRPSLSSGESLPTL